MEYFSLILIKRENKDMELTQKLWCQYPVSQLAHSACHNVLWRGICQSVLRERIFEGISIN